MIPPTTLVTAAELLRMPEQGVRYELVRGELRVREPASGAHGLLAARLVALLHQHVEPRGIGAVFSEATGFHLRSDPDSVRAPDTAFVRGERLPPEGLGPGFLRLAPDLAVEVLSPDDRASEIREKVEEYLACGVLAVWIVDPAARTVTVHESGRLERCLREGDTLDGGAVVPGFAVPVASLFRGVRRVVGRG